jgi:putative spermidine/putrescine transport system permease protein
MSAPSFASAAPRLGGLASRLSGRGLLVLPALALLALAFFYPVGEIVSRAFTDHTSSQGGALANLKWYFGDAAQMHILLRTFRTALVVTVVCVLVGYPYAYLMTISTKRWQMLLFGIVVISAWQSILVRNYAWRILLRDDGLINDAIAAVGLPRAHLLGTATGVTIGMTQVMAPFMILPLFASMRNIDRRLLLAARSLGASPPLAFARIFVPLSLPGIVAGGLLVFVLSLGFYITPALLGSPTDSLLSQAIVLQINRLLDWGHAGAMAFMLLVLTLLILGAVSWVMRRQLERVSGAAGGRKA